MSQLVFSPEAEQDFNDLYDHLAQTSPTRGSRVLDAIERACRLLAQFPGMGRARDDLRPGLRSFPSGSHVIFFEPTADGALIVRILHGARNFPGMFPGP